MLELHLSSQKKLKDAFLSTWKVTLDFYDTDDKVSENWYLW